MWQACLWGGCETLERGSIDALGPVPLIEDLGCGWIEFLRLV